MFVLLVNDSLRLVIPCTALQMAIKIFGLAFISAGLASNCHVNPKLLDGTQVHP